MVHPKSIRISGFARSARTRQPTLKHKPKLGQNFLVDPSASLAIVEALGDISTATVLEIGPGEKDAVETLVRREMAAAYQLGDVALEVSVGFGRTWDDAGH